MSDARIRRVGHRVVDGAAQFDAFRWHFGFFLGAEHALHFFHGFALCFRQQEVDEESAAQCANQEEVESDVFAPIAHHVGEEQDDQEETQQIERGADGAQQWPMFQREHFTHDDEWHVAATDCVRDEQDDERSQRQPAERFGRDLFAPFALAPEEDAHRGEWHRRGEGRQEEQESSSESIHL